MRRSGVPLLFGVVLPDVRTFVGAVGAKDLRDRLMVSIRESAALIADIVSESFFHLGGKLTVLRPRQRPKLKHLFSGQPSGEKLSH
jgi:hypothetical protein